MTVPAPATQNQRMLVVRKHPAYRRWTEDERRQRASYLATRRHLAMFLVAHRFEGDKQPEDLVRSKYGYGIGLNRSWVQEVMGHLLGADVERNWGPMSDDEIAALQADATGNGVTWDNLMQDILERMLTTPGGIVVADLPPPPEQVETRADEEDQRPMFTWVPMSSVPDCGRDVRGFRWTKILETVDNRTPDGEKDKLDENFLVYTLQPDGTTEVARYDAEGNETDTVEMDRMVNADGRATLPNVLAIYGEHPDVPWLGSGLLLGLDDIIVDLFNVLSEVREAYRDAAFGLYVYKGLDYTTVQEQLAKGSRLIGTGEEKDSALERIAADPGEIDAGLRLLEMGTRAWAAGAKRKMQEAMEGAEARSGVSLKAEFQLDMRPLLVTIADALDQVETEMMVLAAQLYGHESGLDDIACTRERDFQMENEESRLSRIVGEFLENLPLPGEAIRAIIKRWVAVADLGIDLDEQNEDGRTVGDLLDEQINAISASQQEEAEVGRGPQSLGAPGPETF